MAKRLVQHYDETGEDEKKHQLEESIERATQKPSPSVHFDFRNPPNELLKDAKSHGVDLTDPATVNFLEELQEEEQNGGSPRASTDKSEERMPTDRDSPSSKTVEKKPDGNSISGAEALVRLVITAVLLWQRRSASRPSEWEHSKSNPIILNRLSGADLLRQTSKDFPGPGCKLS